MRDTSKCTIRTVIHFYNNKFFHIDQNIFLALKDEMWSDTKKILPGSQTLLPFLFSFLLSVWLWVLPNSCSAVNLTNWDFYSCVQWCWKLPMWRNPLGITPKLLFSAQTMHSMMSCMVSIQVSLHLQKPNFIMKINITCKTKLKI